MEKRLKVIIDNPNEMNLLGLMLGRIIERSILVEENENRAGRMRGLLGVTAGQMSVTLSFSEKELTVSMGLCPALKAAVKGSLTSFLDIAIHHRPVKHFLAGSISLKGNPFFALKALPLFYVPKAEV